MRLSSNNLWLGGELQLCTWGRILCFKFSLNTIRIFLLRETDTKIDIAKYWVIVNFYKKAILQLTIWQNWCFIQFYHPRIEVLQLAELLAPIGFFVSFSIERKFKTQNPNLDGDICTWTHTMKLVRYSNLWSNCNNNITTY